MGSLEYKFLENYIYIHKKMTPNNGHSWLMHTPDCRDGDLLLECSSECGAEVPPASRRHTCHCPQRVGLTEQRDCQESGFPAKEHMPGVTAPTKERRRLKGYNVWSMR